MPKEPGPLERKATMALETVDTDNKSNKLSFVTKLQHFFKKPVFRKIATILPGKTALKFAIFMLLLSIGAYVFGPVLMSKAALLIMDKVTSGILWCANMIGGGTIAENLVTSLFAFSAPLVLATLYNVCEKVAIEAYKVCFWLLSTIKNCCSRSSVRSLQGKVPTDDKFDYFSESSSSDDEDDILNVKPSKPNSHKNSSPNSNLNSPSNSKSDNNSSSSNGFQSAFFPSNDTTRKPRNTEAKRIPSEPTSDEVMVSEEDSGPRFKVQSNAGVT